MNIFSLIDLIILLLFLVVITFILKAIALWDLAKRRNIRGLFLAYVPLCQIILLEEIADNINEFKQKKMWHSSVSTLITLILFIIVFILYKTTVFKLNLLSISAGVILFILFRTLEIASTFKIYKDYAPKICIFLLLLSIFLFLDSLILFSIRKRVPVSMCFSLDNEWLFDANKSVLQMYWNEYHSYDTEYSWGEFLMLKNFVPIQNFNQFFYMYS